MARAASSSFAPNLLEPRFIFVYCLFCIYYFYVQWPNFDALGQYRGVDPAKKSYDLAISHNDSQTAEYYKHDRQAGWHQQYYNAFSDGGLFQYGHCFGGYVWWAGMFIQLCQPIRRRWPNFHRWTGYAAWIAGQALAISGIYGLLGEHLDLTANAYREDLKEFEEGFTKTVLTYWLHAYVLTFWIHGFWLSYTGIMYFYYIYNGNRPLHRKWILRHMMVGLATLTKRMMYMWWPLILMHSPIDLHWVPGSVVKATCANLPIYFWHPVAQFLIETKRFRSWSDYFTGNKNKVK